MHEFVFKGKANHREETIPGSGWRNLVCSLTFHPQEVWQLMSNGYNRGNKKRRNLYYFHDCVYSRFYFFWNKLHFSFPLKHLHNTFFTGNVPRVNAGVPAILSTLHGLWWWQSQQTDSWHAGTPAGGATLWEGQAGWWHSPPRRTKLSPCSKVQSLQLFFSFSFKD